MGDTFDIANLAVAIARRDGSPRLRVICSHSATS
jgi:hypothetical protein